MERTAVEWIEEYLKKFNHIEESLSLRKAFEQAKQMEIDQAEKLKDFDTWKEWKNKTN